MERIPEPELMDDPVQARAYAEADFSATDAALVEHFLGRFGATLTATPYPAGADPAIVDLGCGPGNIAFRLAAACPAATVLGLDGAAAMLEIAAARLAATPALADRLVFGHARLPLSAAEARALRPPGGFEAVVSNSLLHHLHDPAVFWRAVALLAAPGAAVFVQDLRRPADAATAEALVAREMAGAPEVLRRDFRASLHAAFTPAEVEAQITAAGLAGLAVEALGDRHLRVAGRLTASAGA
jgi:2-polyprenyl-3-methyl-5-hydroxy-6-metoxy-1,4-benzoquinol methylase